VRLRSAVATSILAALLSSGLLADDKAQILGKAAQLFGEPLSPTYSVFRLNGSYVLWLVFYPQGELLEIAVQPISEASELSIVNKPSKPEVMSDAEYREAVQRISELKDLGPLLESHGSNTTSGSLGTFNFDRFERAYVDRVVADGPDAVKKFDVYFLQKFAGSPKCLSAIDGQPTVSFSGDWYYLSPAEARKVDIGTWQTLQVAGPNHFSDFCFRTKVLHDEDGFIMEEPPNETIILDDIHVKALAGKVHLELSQEGIPGANVELLRVGTKKVIGRKTNDSGRFSFSGLPEGKYKFKVTKDGLKSLSGFVFLDHRAQAEHLSFALPVGT
jgi:hypothetical protein